MPEESSKNKPIKEFRIGRIKLAIWENEGKADTENAGKKFLSYNLTKSYKDKDDQWKESKSFNRNELRTILTIVSEADRWSHFEYDQKKSDT